MSNPIIERFVDERGNVGVRASQEVTVLTREESERVLAKFERMRRVCQEMHDHIKANCDVCDEYFCGSWDEDNECCVYDSYMRELGIEENDG